MPSAIGNFFIKAILNSPLHPMLGDSFAVITVQGRKTGRLHSIPINVAAERGVFTVVSLSSRMWWRNLRGGRIAQLRVSGKTLAVRGEIVEQHDQVLEGLTGYIKRYPGYAKYFGLRLTADGQLSPDDLERIAGERVIIRLRRAEPV